MKELTSGFDVVAHVSQEAIQRIFRSYYWLGNLPNYATKSFSQDGTEHTIEVYFKEPTLELLFEGSKNRIRLTFDFIARSSKYDWEDAASASVLLSAIPLTFPDGDTNLTALGIDFQGVGPGGFSFASVNYPDFESIIKPLILSSLLNTEPIILTPPTSISAELVTWRIYPDAEGHNFLAVFISTNKTASESSSLPETLNSFLRSSDDVRIAVPVENVDEAIANGLASMELDELPTTLTIDDDEYTVEAISITLADFYLSIRGDVDDVEFDARANLYATDAGLEVGVVSLDIDMPWYMDIANTFAGGALMRALEGALPDAVGTVGVSAFVGVGVFANSVPNVDLLLDVHNHGFVNTSKQGIVLSASVMPIFEPAPIKKPTYVKANWRTKEFHRPGCPYGAKLKWQNTVTFIREAAAIRAGYNGCFTCARELSHPAGHVVFGYRSEGNASEAKVDVHVVVEWKLMEPVVINGVTVTDPPFRTSLETTATTDANGVWLARDRNATNLAVRGLWRFRAHSDSWTGECTVRIKPTARNFGAVNYVAFTVGKPEGTAGYGEMPPFP